jgi:isopenicillin N synthase-like dioxygenase
MSSFTAIPILDYSLSRDANTKPAFLDELRRVLLEVGFLYIKNTGIDEALVEEIMRLGEAFFDLCNMPRRRKNPTRSCAALDNYFTRIP